MADSLDGPSGRDGMTLLDGVLLGLVALSLACIGIVVFVLGIVLFFEAAPLSGIMFLLAGLFLFFGGVRVQMYLHHRIASHNRAVQMAYEDAERLEAEMAGLH